MEDKTPKNENLTNILIITVSCIILMSLLESIKVSGETKYKIFLAEMSIAAILYLTAYFLLGAFFHIKKRTLDPTPIMLISVLGSFLLALYIFVRGLYVDWNYISKNPNDLFQRHIKDIVFAIFLLSFVYSIICLLATGCADILMNRAKKKSLT